MRTDTQRVAKYDAKTVPADVKVKIDASLTLMKAGFASAMMSLVDAETRIQSSLNANGTISTCNYPFYLSFGRELWASQEKGISGQAIVLMASSMISKWTARGLSQSMLQAIRSDVFTIDAP